MTGLTELTYILCDETLYIHRSNKITRVPVIVTSYCWGVTAVMYSSVN